MNLNGTPENPIPEGAEVAALTASDGLTLRAARWTLPGAANGTVVVANGRGEFIEKYFEVISELLARGLHVVAFDWRGQGGSARELPNPRKGHVDDFALYLRDLDALREQVLVPHCPKPWFGLGHSMGGAILLMQAHDGRSPFARLVLSAPMIDLAGLKFPRAVRWLAAALDTAGFGGSYIPGSGDTAYLTRPFEGNALTSDPVRYAIAGQAAVAAPRIAIGGPTVGWLNAAFRQMRAFEDGDYAAAIRVPALIVAAGNDTVVATPAIERFARQMKAGHALTIAHARHEILVERDIFRDQFWAAFDAFVPGTRAA